MLNHIAVMGRFVSDPELRKTGNGTSVASFTLAVDRDIPNKQTGEKETDFIDIVAWRQTAEFVSKYFAKGRMAVASGRLQIRNWTDKDGNKRRTAEIVADNVYFGDSKKDSDNFTQLSNDYAKASVPSNFADSKNSNGNSPAPASDFAAPAQDFAMLDDTDGQLPF